MKILYVVNYFPPNTGAAALNSFKISEYLISYGHEVLVLTPGDMGRSLKLNSPKRNIDLKGLCVKKSNSYMKAPLSWVFSHYENFIKFYLKLKPNFSPDIILSQYHAFHYASVVSNYISKISKIPHIVRSHDIFIDLASHSSAYNLFNSLTYPAIFRSIPKSDIFYVVSTEIKQYLENFNKFKTTKFKVHHNGIDTNLFYPREEQDYLKDQFGCETILSFIGLITEDIGLQNIIKVLPEIFKDHRETHIIIIGEGSYLEKLKELVIKLGIKKQVHFLGVKPHTEIPHYINNSDIGIGKITSKKLWTYSVPIKCLEYMACKKPFISTPLSKDIIQNDDVGFTIKQKVEKKELINSLSMLIEDKSLQIKLGEKGMSKVKESFDWKGIMKNFNDDLKSLVI